MEKGQWKVTLSDGTVIEDLILNGDNFVSQKEIRESDFAGRLSSVKIEGPEDENDAGLRGEHGPMILSRCQRDDGLGGYAFAFSPIPASELRLLQLRGDIEYTAMMAGVAL